MSVSEYLWAENRYKAKWFSFGEELVFAHARRPFVLFCKGSPRCSLHKNMASSQLWPRSVARFLLFGLHTGSRCVCHEIYSSRKSKP